MAQLKSLELQGYKTFANRTLFEFSDLITVIVGPNGSGKSNIADSIRWVLGEQSYRLLRGKKTEDMIFSGSEHRARSGMASATITFDNQEGWLPIDFSEVAITRRAYRDGQNEYLINGQRMRLKDVSELLAKSGLAERTYTIIGQGLVDAALALRADERRRLFEEAAGIGLYRSRREEALRRLETTQRNIERVQDILLELKPRLRSLDRQARRAREFEQVKQDLQVVMREWYGFHWHRAQRELTEAMDNVSRQENELKRVTEEQSLFESELNQLQDKVHGLRSNMGEWTRSSSQLQSSREKFNLDIAIIEEKMHSLTVQMNRARSETDRLCEEETFHEERIAISQNEIHELEAEQRAQKEHLETIQLEYDAIKRERTSLEQALHLERQKLVGLVEKQSKLEIQLSEKKLQLQSDRESLDVVDDAIEMLDSRRENYRSELEDAETKLRQAEDIQKSFVDEHMDYASKLERVEEALREHEIQRAKIKSDFASTQAQIDVINQAEKNLVGYSVGTQLLMRAGRELKVSGIRGILSSHFVVPEEYEIATAAALGEFKDAVIIDTDPDIALGFLSEQNARGVIIPLSLYPYLENKDLSKVENEEGVIGILSKVLQAKTDVGELLHTLLGNVILINHRGYAVSVIRKIRNTFSPGETYGIRLVSLSGEVFYASGPVISSGAGADKDSKTILSRSRQREELQQNRKQIQQQMDELDSQLDDLKKRRDDLRNTGSRIKEHRTIAVEQYETALSKLNRLRLEEQQAYQNLQWQEEQRSNLLTRIERIELSIEELTGETDRLGDEIATVKSDLDRRTKEIANVPIEQSQSRLAHQSTNLAVRTQALEDAKKRLQDLLGIYKQVQKSITDHKSQIQAFTDEINELSQSLELKQQEKSGLESQLKEMNQKVSPAEYELAELEEQLVSARKADSASRNKVSHAEHRYAQTRIESATKYEALESIKRRIEDDLGLVDFEYSDRISGPTPLPFEGIVNDLPIVKKLSPEVDEMIKRQRAQLRRIGPVNPEAQEEFEELDERYTFLSDQIEDLEKAEHDVREVIAELDELMEREFCDTFEKVAKEFKQIFSRLFNGGSAQLMLTDTNDITNTGIEIEAKLPGRRMQGLSLLSGGERSLTATALVFALLKVSPTPFCLLDEVDAMLDEANLVRFREMLQELSQNTQFVVVTHNRNTVQSADIIYGVTMGRDSVSQVVSLKPDEHITEVSA